MIDYIEYDYTCVQTDDLEDNGDVKAIICIDGYPMNAYGEQVTEGYVVAQVILSKHNDIIIVWNGMEGKLNPDVLSLIEKAKIEIQEYQ